MSENAASPEKDRRWIYVIAALAVCCIAIYGQTYNFDFINIDDRSFVYENPAVLAGLTWKSFYWGLTAFHSSNWVPMSWWSLMLDISLFGPKPGMLHLTNTLLHTIDAILVFIVFKRMTGGFWQSAAVAFLFAVHPAHVESVAWIAERRDVLSMLFFLLTILAYLKYVTCTNVSESERKKNNTGLASNPQTWFVLTTILFALGLMSKPMLVTLPFVLLLCDYWSLGRLNQLRDLQPLVIEKVPLFVLTAVSSFITFSAQSSSGATVSLQALTIGERLINVVISYAKYIVMMFYPVNLGLWYPFDERVDPLMVIGATALIAVVSAFCWHQRKDRRYLLMGWLWFLGTLVPVIGLVQVGLQSLADRYTYIPYLGLFIMLAWGIGDLVKKFQINSMAVTAAGLLILVTLGGLSFAQTARWKNSETLYTHTLSFTKNNHFLLSNLCLYYVNNADHRTADERCSELLAQTPPTAEGYKILGELKMENSKFAEAAEQFNESLKIEPTSGIVNLDLATAYAKTGNLNEAEEALKRTLATNDKSVSRPQLARALTEIGRAFVKTGQTDKAEAYFQKAIEIDPTTTEAPGELRKMGKTQ